MKICARTFCKKGISIFKNKHAIYCSRKCQKKAYLVKQLKKRNFYLSHKLLLVEALGGKCTKCYTSLKLQIDHIIPISKGGENNLKNVQLLCFNCHNKKTKIDRIKDAS